MTKRILMIVLFPLAFLVFWLHLFFVSNEKLKTVEQAISKLTQ